MTRLLALVRALWRRLRGRGGDYQARGYGSGVRAQK